jgi:hypothetical protein
MAALHQTTFEQLPIGAAFFDDAYSGDWCVKDSPTTAIGPSCAQGWTMGFRPNDQVLVGAATLQALEKA